MSNQEKYEFSDYGRSPRQSPLPALAGAMVAWLVVAAAFAWAAGAFADKL